MFALGRVITELNETLLIKLIKDESTVTYMSHHVYYGTFVYDSKELETFIEINRQIDSQEILQDPM